MMERLNIHHPALALFSIMSIILLSACCHFTTLDCNCKPSEHKLKNEVLEWIAPYNQLNFFIFQDSLGNTDSLRINRFAGTTECGGEECISTCHTEKRILQSVKYPDLTLNLTASFGNVLEINANIIGKNMIYLWFNAIAESAYNHDENIATTLSDDYLWNNQKTRTLKINCKDKAKCYNYNMSEIILSKDFGLIEYVDVQGIRWKKID